MASSRSAEPQPSAAFLLKCAKEKEKLRNCLLRDHREQVLRIFEDQLYSDIIIKTCKGEILSTHSGILKIRVPTFYNYLLESNSYLPIEKPQIQSFLKHVYTNDDIRKHECNILRQLQATNDPNSNADENLNTMCDSLTISDHLQLNKKVDVPTHLAIPELEPPQGSTCDDSPMSTSSMVRSGTFDLQTPLALEKALDDGKFHTDIERVSKPEGFKEAMANTTKIIQQAMTTVDSDAGFFLHCQNSAGNRIPDANMTDSGFLSQSLVSESSSVASSLMTSWEANASISLSYVEKDRTSPMFPLFIDGDKSKAQNGTDLAKDSVQSGQNSAETNSSKTMDLIAELPKDNGRTPGGDTMQRPKSCYMFIDFDSVQAETRNQNESRKQSLSMFVDLNGDDIKEQLNGVETQKVEGSSSISEGIPDLIQSQDVTKFDYPSSATNLDPKSSYVCVEIHESPRKVTDVKVHLDEPCLLPMSPILRRKTVKKEPPKIVFPEVLVKASTKPQDVDALKFRRSLSEDAESSLAVGSTEETKHDDDVKNSNENSVPLNTANAPVLPTDLMQSEVANEPIEVCHSVQEADDDTETVYSEVSDVSSSVLGGLVKTLPHGNRSSDGEEASVTGGHNLMETLEACSKLGEDLLRMFLEEISPDVVIHVEDKEIKAHKCILISRCRYFAAMLTGDWLESSGNTINLEGFSYPVVHFALCHLYSGAISLPHGVSISELAVLADVWSLDTLKDVIVFYLKMNYCHFFHKPCAHCTIGVVECLPIAAACNLSDVHAKSVKWIGRYFTRVWPTKAFASLSEDMKEQCYQQTIYNLSVDTVVDMTLNCDKLMGTLPHVKWAEPVFGLVTRLLEDCIHFLASQFDQVLTSDSFMALGKSQSWNVAALEDSVLSAVELVNPDTACRMFIKLGRVIPATESESAREMGKWTQNFLDLLHRVQRHCERYLIHNANRVVHSESWALLAPEVQKKIKDAAVIVFEFEKPTAPPPRLSSLQRKQKRAEDKSLTFPRKAQVVRGKKTSKSFRERSMDKLLGDEVAPRTPERHRSRSETCDQRQEYSEESGSPVCTSPLPPMEGDIAMTETSMEPAPSATQMESKRKVEASVERKRARKASISDKLVQEIILRDGDAAVVSVERKDSPMSADSLQSFPLSSPSKDDDPGCRKRTFSPTCSIRSTSQVAMVSPFSVKTSPAEDDGAAENDEDLVAEIDEETMLVNNCLQEAEILEQALARKLHKQANRPAIQQQVSPEPARPAVPSVRTNGECSRNRTTAAKAVIKRESSRAKKSLIASSSKQDQPTCEGSSRSIRGVNVLPRTRSAAGSPRTKSALGPTSVVSKRSGI